MLQAISWSVILGAISVTVFVQGDQNFSVTLSSIYKERVFTSADILLTAGYFGWRRYLDFWCGPLPIRAFVLESYVTFRTLGYIFIQ